MTFDFFSEKKDSETRVGNVLNLEGGLGADFLSSYGATGSVMILLLWVLPCGTPTEIDRSPYRAAVDALRAAFFWSTSTRRRPASGTALLVPRTISRAVTLCP